MIEITSNLIASLANQHPIVKKDGDPLGDIVDCFDVHLLTGIAGSTAGFFGGAGGQQVTGVPVIVLHNKARGYFAVHVQGRIFFRDCEDSDEFMKFVAAVGVGDVTPRLFFKTVRKDEKGRWEA